MAGICGDDVAITVGPGSIILLDTVAQEVTADSILF